MQVREGMSSETLTIGPEHTLRAAAELMSQKRVGSAIVLDPDQPGPGILTERDVLRAVGAGKSVDEERVADHLTSDVISAAPDWSLEEAAATMIRGGFRHLIVTEGGEIVGMLSVRDVVRCWTRDGAKSEIPAAVSSTA